MRGPAPNLKYTGSALPGNAESIVLFSTTYSLDGVHITSAALAAAARGYAMPKNYLGIHGLKRFIVRLTHDQTLTLTAAHSKDRGVNWIVHSTEAITAHAANSETVRDYLVEPFGDWRLLLVNSATPQTVFTCWMGFDHERGVAAPE